MSLSQYKNVDIASSLLAIFAECSSLLESENPAMLGKVMELENLLRSIINTDSIDIDSLDFSHCDDLFSLSTSPSIGSSGHEMHLDSTDKSSKSDNNKSSYTLSSSTWKALHDKVMGKYDAFKANLSVDTQIDIFHPDGKWYNAKIVAIDASDKNLVTLRYRGFKDPKYMDVMNMSEFQPFPSGFRVRPAGKKPTLQYTNDSIKSRQTIDESHSAGSYNGRSSNSSSNSNSNGDSLTSNYDANVDGGSDSLFLTKSGRVVKKASTVPKYSTIKEDVLTAFYPAEQKKTAVEDVGPKPKKSQKSNLGEEDDNDWLCGVCGLLETTEDSALIACDGYCKRSFHSGCLELSEEKKEELNTSDSWWCRDCVFGEHSCFICGKLGMDSVDVFKCKKNCCGKYYHIKCVSNHDSNFLNPDITPMDGPLQIPDDRWRRESHNLNIDFPWNNSKTQSKNKQKTITSPSSNSNSNSSNSSSSNSNSPVKEVGNSRTIRSSYSFNCSYHTCDTCHVFYRNPKFRQSNGSISSILFPCIKCPRAFHINCIPPGSRYNPDFFLCPKHPGAYLPSTKVMDPKARAAANTKNIDFFWEQMILPEKTPDPSDIYGTHFRLPIDFQEDVKQQSSEFKIIRVLDTEYLRSKNMQIPLSKMTDAEDELCKCEGFCDDTCMNRSVKVECNDNNCCVGQDCGNRLFAQRKYILNEKFREFKMGWGLRALEFVQKGRLIIEYIGEVIDGKEVFRRMTDQRKYTPSDQDFYIMELGQGLYVDGKFKGNVSRFINHSCDPNCELDRWEVDGKIRIGIYSCRDIQENEPLSYDYQFDTQEADMFKCYCNTAKCRGTMAPKKREEKCAGILSAYSSSLNIPSDFQINPVTGRCDAIDEIIKSDKLSSKDRVKLANEGQKIAFKFEQDMKNVDVEKQRSWVSKFLPGDAINEIRSGPPLKMYKLYARDHQLFLPRNARASANWLKRRRESWVKDGNGEYFTEFCEPCIISPSSWQSSATSSGGTSSPKKSPKRNRSSI